MNRAILEGKWDQLKGDVRETWGELTNDDLERIQGSVEKLTGVLRERYGWTLADATRRVADYLGKLEERFSEPSATIR